MTASGPGNIQTNVGTDVNLFVSGAATAGTTRTATSLFGGDIVSSGSLYLDGRIYNLGDNDTYIRPQSDRWRIFAGNIELADFNASTAQKSVILNRGGADVDFVVESVDRSHAISLNAADNKVFILSGANVTGGDGADVSLFVSGKITSQGGYKQGTSVFGGDVAVSGTLYANPIGSNTHTAFIVGKRPPFQPGDTAVYISGSIHSSGSAVKGATVVNGDLVVSGGAGFKRDLSIMPGQRMHFNGPGGSLFMSSSATTSKLWLDAGTNLNVDYNSEVAFWYNNATNVFSIQDNRVVVNTSGENIDFRVEGGTGLQGAVLVDAGTNQVLIGTDKTSAQFTNPGGNNVALPGDVGVYISGSVFGKNNTSGDKSKGVLMVGGDLVVSGNTYLALREEAGNGKDGLESFGLDGNVFVSGSIHSTGSIVPGTSVFGGDIVVSGGLGVKKDISVTTGQRIHFNGPGGDQYIYGDGSDMYIESDNNLYIDANNWTRIRSGLYVNPSKTSAFDFRASSGQKQGAVLLDAGTNQIGLLVDASAAASAYSETHVLGGAPIPNDVGIYVSGSKGGRGKTSGDGSKGVAVFGGDVVISGSLHGGSPLSVGGDMEVSGTLTLSGSSTTFVTGAMDITGSMFLTGSLTVSGSNTLTVFGPSIFNEGGSTDSDFRVETDVKTHAFFVDASEDRVLIHSGGGVTSFNEGAADDVNFYVSGTIGNFQSSMPARGVAVFGGDTYISGTLIVSGGLAQGYGSISGSIFQTATGISYIKAGTGMTVTSASNGQITLSAAGTIDGSGANERISYWTDSDTLASNSGFTFDGTAGGSTGNLTVAGNINVADDIIHSGDTDTKITFDTNKIQLKAGNINYVNLESGVIQLNGDSGAVSTVINTANKTAIATNNATDQVLILSGGSALSFNEAAGTDVSFYVSGSSGSRAKAVVGTQGKGISLFGGDLVTSGTLYVSGTIQPFNDTDSYIKFHNGHPSDFQIVANNQQLFTRDAAGTPDAIVLNADNAAISALWKVNDKFSFGSLASTNQVFINADTAQEGGADTAFWVSGSLSSRGTAKRGTAVFAGDTYISGTLVVSGGIANVGDYGTISGSIFQTATGLSYIRAGSNITVASASNGQITISSTGGGGGAVENYTNASDNRVLTSVNSDTINGEANLTFDGSTFTVTGDTSLDGGVVINEGSADKDFRVESNANTHMLFVNGGTNRLSIGTAGASPETTVHVQDATPTLRIQRSSNANNSTIEWAGQAGVRANAIHLGTANDLVFNTWKGGSLDESLRFSGDNESIIFLSGSGFGDNSLHPARFTDTVFYVSGTVGSRGTAIRGASVFGGDVVVSGTLSVNRGQAGVGSIVTVSADGKVGIGTDTPSYKLEVGGNMAVGEYIYHRQDANTFLRFETDKITAEAGGKPMLSLTEAGTDTQVLVLSGGAAGSYDESTGADVNFYVSGSRSSKGTPVRGTSLFGGDVAVSGTMNMGTVKVQAAMHNSDFTYGSQNGTFQMINSSGGAVTGTLPGSGVIGGGHVLIFKDIGGFAGNPGKGILIKPAANEFIDGAEGGAKIQVNSGSLQLISDGLDTWFIVGRS